MGISNTVQHHTTADLTELVGTQLFKPGKHGPGCRAAPVLSTLTLSNGERLIVPGQTVDKIHLLLQGSLQVFDGEPSGTPVGTIRQGNASVFRRLSTTSRATYPSWAMAFAAAGAGLRTPDGTAQHSTTVSGTCCSC